MLEFELGCPENSLLTAPEEVGVDGTVAAVRGLLLPLPLETPPPAKVLIERGREGATLIKEEEEGGGRRMGPGRRPACLELKELVVYRR